MADELQTTRNRRKVVLTSELQASLSAQLDECHEPRKSPPKTPPKKVSNTQPEKAPMLRWPSRGTEKAKGQYGTLTVQVFQARIGAGLDPSKEGEDNKHCFYYALEFGEQRFESTMCRWTNAPSWDHVRHFPVDDTDHRLVVRLMDGKSDAMHGAAVGQMSLSLTAIVEAMVNDHFPNHARGGNGKTVRETIDEYYVGPAGEAPSSRREKWYELYEGGGVGGEGMGAAVGKVLVAVEYREDLLGLLARKTFLEPDEPPCPGFQLQKVKEAGERLQAMYQLSQTFLRIYKNVFKWQSRGTSAVILVVSVYICLTADMEYFALYPLTMLIAILFYTLYVRVSGGYLLTYLEERTTFKPDRGIGTLRIAVVEARNLQAPNQTGSKCNPSVRVFYKPLGPQGGAEGADELLAKHEEQKRYYIGCTRSIRGTCNPNFQVAGKEAAEKQGTRGVLKGIWDSGKFVPEESRGSRDATLHNVKEVWRHDGTVDPDTLKYPLLQPLAPSEETAAPWSTIPGSIVFEVYQDEAQLIGYTEVPLNQMLADQGGVQPVVSAYRPLQMPRASNSSLSALGRIAHFVTSKAHTTSEKSTIAVNAATSASSPFEAIDKLLGGPEEESVAEDTSQDSSSLASRMGTKLKQKVSHALDSSRSTKEATPQADIGILQFRVQVTLPKENTSITDADRTNQTTLEDMLQEDNGSGILYRIKQARASAARMQASMELMATRMEKAKNLWTWAHPSKTGLFLAGLVASWVASFLVPFRYLVLGTLLSKFYSGAQNQQSKYSRSEIMFQNLVWSIPSDLDMQEAYKSRKQQHRQQMADRAALKVTLQAQWMGELWKQGEHNPALKLRFVVVRAGRILWWKSKLHAVELGARPRGQLILVPTETSARPERASVANAQEAAWIEQQIEFPLSAGAVRASVGMFGFPADLDDDSAMGAITGQHVFNVEDLDAGKKRRVIFASTAPEVMHAFMTAVRKASIHVREHDSSE